MRRSEGKSEWGTGAFLTRFIRTRKAEAGVSSGSPAERRREGVTPPCAQVIEEVSGGGARPESSQSEQPLSCRVRPGHTHKHTHTHTLSVFPWMPSVSAVGFARLRGRGRLRWAEPQPHRSVVANVHPDVTFASSGVFLRVASDAGVAVWLPGYLSVMMNCQWQSLLCQVDGGLLNMFGEGEEAGEAERSPQCTVPLRGCQVRDGPDTEHSYRITLSSSDQVAMLEVSWQTGSGRWRSAEKQEVSGAVNARLGPSLQVSSWEEKQRWLTALRDGAAHRCHRDNKSPQGSRGGAFR